MKKVLEVGVFMLLLLVAFHASARGHGVGSSNSSVAVVVAPSSFSPKVLIAVRRTYCPDSPYRWHAGSEGMVLHYKKGSQDFVLIDWEGSIFNIEVGWDTVYKKLGSIDELK